MTGSKEREDWKTFEIQIWLWISSVLDPNKFWRDGDWTNEYCATCQQEACRRRLKNVSGTGMRQWPRSTYGVMNHEPRDAWTWVLGQLRFLVSPVENFEHTNGHVFFLAGNLPFSLFLFNPFAGPFRGMMQHICVCWVQDLHIHCRYTVEAILGDSKRCKRGIFWARFRKFLGVWRDGSRLTMVAAETLKCLSKSEN